MSSVFLRFVFFNVLLGFFLIYTFLFEGPFGNLEILASLHQEHKRAIPFPSSLQFFHQ
jgi:uncharacterized membrane-anchored protein YitT (DUF2179 family)